MTNQAIPEAVTVCDSCGERAATPPMCEDCRADRVAHAGGTLAAGWQLSTGQGRFLLDEIDRLRATIARRGEEYDGMRDQFGSQVGALRDHWYRDRDRALQAEADRDRLARQVQAAREWADLQEAEHAKPVADELRRFMGGVS